MLCRSQTFSWDTIGRDYNISLPLEGERLGVRAKFAAPQAVKWFSYPLVVVPFSG